jgi:hypothetical protein
MNEDQNPVTLGEFKAGLAVQKEELRTELHAALGAQKEELKLELEGFMRQIETNILTAFHGYARGVSTRIHTLDIAEQDVRTRLGFLEDRVLALETRRHS